MVAGGMQWRMLVLVVVAAAAADRKTSFIIRNNYRKARGKITSLSPPAPVPAAPPPPAPIIASSTASAAPITVPASSTASAAPIAVPASSTASSAASLSAPIATSVGTGTGYDSISGALPLIPTADGEKPLREHLRALEKRTLEVSKCSRTSSGQIPVLVSTRNGIVNTQIKTQLFTASNVPQSSPATTDTDAPVYFYTEVLKAAKRDGHGDEGVCKKGMGRASGPDRKPKWFLATYADGASRKRGAERLKQQAKKYPSINKVFAFGPEDIDVEFRQKNQKILSQKHGVGLWLWKSYVILKLLVEHMEDGDSMCYVDSDNTIVTDPAQLFCLAQNSHHGVVVFTNNHRESLYTKRDNFVRMGVDNYAVAATMQVDEAAANYHCWQRRGGGEGDNSVVGVDAGWSNSSLAFVAEWRAYCQDIKNMDETNECGLPNHKGFKGHREDQSVLSLMAKRWNIQTFPEPSQWSLPPNCPTWKKKCTENLRQQKVSKLNKVFHA